MFESTDRQRGLVGWSVSVLLHAGLLIFGAIWLIHPARFHVEPGKTSTEIDLIFTTAPVPVTTPPARPAPVPEPIKPQVTTKPEPIFTPPIPSIVAPAKSQPPKPLMLPRPAYTQETSSTSRGAIQAQPDDLHNEPPEYPEESRIAREQGMVILQVEVAATGEPASVSILKSSGYFRLDQAARRAVQNWKFHPAMTAGIPVSSEADVPVHFKLQ
jgi:periplasmic protein TonB